MAMCDARVRVLVVEDCPDTAESLRVLLGMWGFDVRVARTGAAGLSIAAMFRPAVALIDLGLPGANGFEVARSFQLLPADELPILVAATGHVGKETRRRAWEAGFDHFVTKPFDPDYLRGLLSNAGCVSSDLCECSPVG
jgi:two-component system CheB/CheR fusion protein